MWGLFFVRSITIESVELVTPYCFCPIEGTNLRHQIVCGDEDVHPMLRLCTVRLHYKQ